MTDLKLLEVSPQLYEQLKLQLRPHNTQIGIERYMDIPVKVNPELHDNEVRIIVSTNYESIATVANALIERASL